MVEYPEAVRAQRNACCTNSFSMFFSSDDALSFSLVDCMSKKEKERRKYASAITANTTDLVYMCVCLFMCTHPMMHMGLVLCVQ